MLLTHVLALLPGLALVSAAATPGLFYVLSKPVHPELSAKDFNDWYTNEHIHDVVKSGLTDLAVRYKNVNSSAQWPYLAVYRLPDVALLKDPKFLGGLPATSPLLPGKTKGSKGGAWQDSSVVKWDMLPYVRTQTFEGQTTQTGRGKGLITSTMEPAAGSDAEFDMWYRHQHLDMLSMLKGYRRSTRYEKLNKSSPRFLAMHELDTTSVAPEIKYVMGTTLAKKMVSTAKFAGRDTWELISEFGKGTVGEQF